MILQRKADKVAKGTPCPGRVERRRKTSYSRLIGPRGTRRGSQSYWARRQRSSHRSGRNAKHGSSLVFGALRRRGVARCGVLPLHGATAAQLSTGLVEAFL